MEQIKKSQISNFSGWKEQKQNLLIQRHLDDLEINMYCPLVEYSACAFPPKSFTITLEILFLILIPLSNQGSFSLSKRYARHNFFSNIGRTNHLKSLLRESEHSPDYLYLSKMHQTLCTYIKPFTIKQPMASFTSGTSFKDRKEGWALGPAAVQSCLNIAVFKVVAVSYLMRKDICGCWACIENRWKQVGTVKKTDQIAWVWA